MAVKLILVRHGQPAVPEVGPTGNPPLSARGHGQARHAAAVLKDEAIDRIVSSGMARTDATAKPLSEVLGIPVHIHAHLGEVDREGGEYASIEHIRAKGPDEWRRFLASPIAYFGLDPIKFRAETLAAFKEVFNSGSDQTVAIFTHAFPINIILTHALGIDGEARFVPGHTSITRLTGRSFDALTVVSINEAAHIPWALK